MFIERRKSKILSNKNLKNTINALRQFGKKIVFTNGCFDILHPGHLKLLKEAKSFGDILIVGLNSDGSLKLLKGENRPIVKQKDRLVIIASLKIVDFVIIFEEETPFNLIKSISPDVLVKGGDYNIDEIVGGDYINQIGGEVKIVKLKEGYSTSKLINNLKK